MSKEGMLGRIPLALNSLTNDRLNLVLGLVNDLGGSDGPAWAAHLARVHKAGLPAQPPMPNLLEEVGQPTEVAAVARFVASKKFVVDRNGELPISGFGANFKTHFLGVTEDDVPAATLKQRKLLKPSVSSSILAAHGDTDLANIKNARVPLAHVFDFLKTADRTKCFIFYPADAKRNVWAVSAYWFGGGWHFAAGSVEGPDWWFEGRMVVSR